MAHLAEGLTLINDAMVVGDDLITLNISGSIFVIPRWQLMSRAKHSRLAMLAVFQKDSAAKLCDYYFEDEKQFYFARSPTIFQFVLDFYRAGDLHVPTSKNCCLIEFCREMEYWNISLEFVKECCISNLPKKLRHQVKVARYTGSFIRLRKQLWEGLHFPLKHRWSKIYVVATVILVLTSCASMIANTFCDEPGECGRYINETWEDITPYDSVYGYPEIAYIDLLLAIWLTIEMLVASFACPDRKRNLYHPIAIVIMLTIVPIYLTYILSITLSAAAAGNKALRFVAALRGCRVFLFIKFARFSRTFNTVFNTLIAAGRELILFFCIALVICLMVATLIYYIQREPDSQKNLLISMYFAYITVTTVGYGDYVPKGPSTKVVTCISIMLGVTIVGFATSVIISRFTSTFEDECMQQYLRSAGISSDEYWKPKIIVIDDGKGKCGKFGKSKIVKQESQIKERF